MIRKGLFLVSCIWNRQSILHFSEISHARGNDRQLG